MKSHAGEDNYRKTLQRWERIYLEEVEGLMEERRGKRSSRKKKNTKD